jgi:uroporphyrinogen-III decarboxylase
MNSRERYIETMKFGTPDKIPFSPGGPRESTLKRWRSEGMDDSNQSWWQCVLDATGVVEEKSDIPRADHGVNFLMEPMFEEKVLEHKDGHYIVQDWKGNICEISDEFDVSYLRNAVDFVTRAWIKCPVESHADWEDMKTRYKLENRYPEDFDDRVKILKQRDYTTAIGLHGPFWQLREWCGFEGLCMFMVEDPEFVMEMANFWMEFVSKNMERVLDAGVIDILFVNEDMAYKEKSMISPAMTRQFIMPSWTRWSKEAHDAGVSLIELDSDGKVDELIPLMIESGVDVNLPIEVAAGNDIVEYRKRFGHDIAYSGGIDKRCMAKGGQALIDELARNEPVVRDGGFIPGCDHGVPHDVSWPNFVAYSKMLAEMTGWL